jgi:hypothetical protein
MPSEVSDIKQFIEICRRKDAKCTLSKLFMLVAVQRGAAFEGLKGAWLEHGEENCRAASNGGAIFGIGTC